MFLGLCVDLMNPYLNQHILFHFIFLLVLEVGGSVCLVVVFWLFFL